MGVALENARLFDETQRLLKETEQRNAELAVINRIQQGIAGSLDFQAIVDMVGDKLREVLHTQDMGIRWIDPAHRTVHYLYEIEHGVRLQIPPEVIPAARFDALRFKREPVLRHTAAEVAAIQRVPGTDSSLCSAEVPIIGGDKLLGSIIVESFEREHAFGDAELRLLSTVAASLGMALDNARLFNETAVALQRQTATARVLQAISRSIADTQPVLDTILGCCSSLLAGTQQTVLLFDDAQRTLALAAHNGPAREVLERFFPWPQADEPFQNAMRQARTLRYDSVLHGADTPEPLRDIVRAMNFGDCAQVFVPLRWEGRGIGTLIVVRAPPVPFSDDEVAMFATFADQAVIAIQNARLFNETKEALERETASAEVLRVVGGSMADAQPVFESICASMSRLLPGADLAIGSLHDDGRIHWRAGFGEMMEPLRSLFPRPAPAHTRTLTGKASYLPDLLHGEGVPDSLREAARRLGRNSSMLSAAMTLGDKVYGTIAAFHFDMRPFSDDDARLIKSFADQAVIAIRNAQLFNETKEALEQQTATAEVLQVISSSVADTQPVFDKILDSCQRLFTGASMGISLVGEDGQIHLNANRSFRAGDFDALAATFPHPAEQSIQGYAMRKGKVLHYPDVLHGENVPPVLHQIGERAGNCSVLIAPMLWEERGVGAIHRLPRTACGVQRQGDRSPQDLCRPGGDRDPERAAVPRNAGGAGTAEGRVRDSPVSSAVRSPMRSRSSKRSRTAVSTCSRGMRWACSSPTKTPWSICGHCAANGPRRSPATTRGPPHRQPFRM